MARGGARHYGRLLLSILPIGHALGVHDKKSNIGVGVTDSAVPRLLLLVQLLSSSPNILLEFWKRMTG